MPSTFKACSIMIDSGFPIKIGSTPVDTATTDVNEPLPGNNPRSVGMAMFHLWK